MAHRLELILIDVTGAPVARAEVKAEAPDVTLSLASDERGIVAIKLEAAPRHLSLHVRKEGFVPKLVAWSLSRAGEQLPEHFTLPMEPAHTIGGFVRNQSGEPVEGARVFISLRGAQSEATEPRVYHDIFQLPVPTDAEGRWEFREAAADLETLDVRLEHPDYISFEHIPVLPPLEDFKNGTAVLTVIKGIPCEGAVTDESGEPVEGVTVFCGEDGVDSSPTPSRKTDAAGRFRFGGIRLANRGKTAALSFIKQDYAPELIELQPATTIVQDVVLRPGKALRVRFFDVAGVPIEGVTMALTFWRERQPFHLHFTSDATGLVSWENAPSDPVGFTVVHDLFQRQEIRLAATDKVHRIVLRHFTTISGKVIDARTKQPIPQFTLIKGRLFPEKKRPWADWNRRSVYSFADGKYHYLVKEPVMMRDGKGGPGETGFHRLRIEAGGYRAAVSRSIGNDEENVVCDFELEPAASTMGTVRDAEGKPAAEAKIALAGAGNPITVRNGKIVRPVHFSVTSNEAGRYELPPQEEDFPVLMVHPQSGYFLTTCSELEAKPEVVLLPWGRLELTATMPKDGAPNCFLHQVQTKEQPTPWVRFGSVPTRVGDKSCHFEHLPAGPMRLGRLGWTMPGGAIVSIENGKTASLDLITGRRTVIGQIALPSGVIVTEQPLARLWLRGNAFEVPFEVDMEGHFQINDVPPGPYKLTALFFRSLPSDQNTQPEMAGVVLKDFELPAGDGEFDLGLLPIISGDRVRMGTQPKPPQDSGGR